MHRFVANQLENNYFILAEDDIKQIKQILRLRETKHKLFGSKKKVEVLV